MKSPAIILRSALAAFSLLLVTAGCSHLDLTPETDPNRVVAGTVNFRSTLPAGAEVYVRVIDPSTSEPPRPIPATDVPLGDRAKVQMTTERVLGDQTIKLALATHEPVPFRIEFRADDALLRHGLNLDARISYEGRVHHRTLNARAISLGSVRYPQEVTVEPIQ
jgi:uncharacterized lipoprotein YbaY